MKIRNILLISVMLFTCCISCTKSEKVKRSAPEFKSSTPENNESDVKLTASIEVVFDEVVTLAENHGITINDVPANVEASFTKLLFSEELSYDSNYKIIIPKGAVINTFNIALGKDIELMFTTEEDISNPGMDFVADMGVGWNLGNSLDSKGKDETVWGNPKTTKALIDAVRAKGFKTLRVPVTWQYHMGVAPEYTIESEWLDRVEEVVNYGLDNEMYVIVNIHHDEEWLIPTYAKVDVVKDQLGKVWTQVANRFKDYSNNLIFESLNETRLKGSDEEWTGGTAEGRDCINQFHQTSVEAIRSTAGNNSTRYIMISTYAASSALAAINDLVLPSSSNLIVSIHNYFPYELCLGENGKDWGTSADKEALENEFDRLYQKFISEGIPVVMGEWGNLNHDNLEDRIRHAENYVRGCVSRGICPIWWDNGNAEEFGIINRISLEWIFPEIAEAIITVGEDSK